jgi:tryptophan synthase beta chain
MILFLNLFLNALAYLFKAFKNKFKNKIIILNLCGRGDKDLFTAAKEIGFDVDE